jgi:Zn-dependent peptidase ImmA (M78 family)
MPRPIPANVTPRLLGWARDQSGLPVEAVARRLGLDPARVAGWERNEGKPTVRQTLQLAKLYRRPFGLFFLQEPPVVTPLAAEYRRLPDVKPGAESPEFRLAVRVMIERRELALELGSDAFPPFDLAARMSEGTVPVAERLRAALGVSVETQLGWPNEWAAWRQWREAVENLGVLVFQFPKVPLTEVRGTALLHFPLPAIGINSRESAPGARVSTLIHELVHVALARGDDERVAVRETRSAAEWLEVERFAEETASQIIIPATALTNALRETGQRGWDVGTVRTLARRFRVTPLAMATRLRAAGAMTWARYRDWRDEWDRFVAALPQRKGGITTPVEKTLGRAGRPLTQLVLEALDSNRITAVDASRYLDLRFDHFEALRAELVTRTDASSVSPE